MDASELGEMGMNASRRGRKEAPLAQGGNPASRLGVTIRAWRQHRELTVTALAEQAGFGRSGRAYVSKVEHGELAPSDQKLDALAEALGVNPADLLRHQLPPGMAEAPAMTGPSDTPPVDPVRGILRLAAELEQRIVMYDREQLPPPAEPALPRVPPAANVPGLLAAPFTLEGAGETQGAQLNEHQVAQIVTNAKLPLRERERAWRHILEAARGICKVIDDELREGSVR